MPKPSKEDDLSWVFDSLVDFLRGPMWNLPIINFIEQKSMIFEPDGDNQKAYKKVCACILCVFLSVVVEFQSV